MYVCCTVQNLTELSGAQLASWCVCQLVQGIYVIDLLFFDQYVTLVKGLHIESFPTIHSFSLTAWFQWFQCFLCSATFMSIVQYVLCIWWNQVIGSYVSHVFFVSCCYWSTGLSYIWMVTSVTFELVYTTGICTGLGYVPQILYINNSLTK